ncbi:MAG: hypothetical protein M3Q97_03735 [Bacteroidota bacterium]|nr:hypothetical protein [Bacteroidota bacterium]
MFFDRHGQRAMEIVYNTHTKQVEKKQYFNTSTIKFNLAYTFAILFRVNSYVYKLRIGFIMNTALSCILICLLYGVACAQSTIAVLDTVIFNKELKVRSTVFSYHTSADITPDDIVYYSFRDYHADDTLHFWITNLVSYAITETKVAVRDLQAR